ncbi:MAG: OmpP1/FadL family transporter [Bacteroidia bacterium]
MRNSFLVLLLCLFAKVNAQNDQDVMRYSQTGIGGDARFVGMAGSFGALGANLSAVNYNPAGLGLYLKGEWNVTGGMRFGTVTADHYGTVNKDYKSNLVIPQMGFVKAFEQVNPYTTDREKKRHKDWSRRTAFALSYNKLANFNYNTTIQADVYNTSITHDFVKQANGHTNQQLNSFYEGLAWNSWLINENAGSTTSYWAMVDPDVTVKQTKTISVVGGMGEYSFALSHAVDNKIYIGGSLNVVRAKYTYDGKHEETDTKDSITYFKTMYFEEVIQSSGVGVNLKLGAIYRVNPSWRLGISLHTPTRLSMTDTYQDVCYAKYDSDSITPSVINGKEFTSSDTGRFRYKVVTPLRSTASIAYIPNKFFAMNVDYEYVNYSQGSLQSTPMVFTDVNRGIRSNYKSTGNLRIGMEANVKPVILRAGFASYGSPFGDMFSGKYVRNTYSIGAGVKRETNFYFDLAIAVTQWKENYYLYNSSLINATKLKFNTTSIIATIGRKF